jgi:hypothetical protein
MIREHILLELEQEELLCKFVEADRQVPKDLRGKFIAKTSSRVAGSHCDFIHMVVRDIKISGNLTDAEILAQKGLLGLSYGSGGSFLFHLLPEAIQYYRELKQAAQPAESIEKEVRGHLSSDAFHNAYPAVLKKWAEAEALLWESDSETQFTTIGHLCREALQGFADVLIRKYNPPNTDTDKAHTIARIKDVLNLHSSYLGSTQKDFLEKLISYWRSVSDLVQRQEHGGQRDNTPLTWEDARRVVFQTCIVMYEVDRSLIKK